MEKLFIYLFTLFLLLTSKLHSQIDTVLANQTGAYFFPSFPIKSSYTSLLDRNGASFLYSANMESGLGIYNISNLSAIFTILDLGISNFDNLDVSTIKQRNNSLFVGIGDFQVNTNTASGLAILDITNPATPIFKDLWDSTIFKHGISHLLVEGDFAYLSTMTDGIIILNIANESDIKFVSKLQLDLNFPSPSSNAHNARGLKYRNDTLFVCFDRGGLRLVDVSNKSNPLEIYKYINTSLNSNAAAAYNDIILKDNFAFVSVDYCGLEVIDISSIPYTTVQWYNPWNCNNTNWSGAEIHTNELKTGNNDSLLFVSAGQSDLLVFNITNPVNTLKIGQFTNLGDTLASHGVDVYNNKVSLSIIHTPFHIPPLTPFFSDPGGFKIFDYTVTRAVGIEFNEIKSLSEVDIYPIPSEDQLSISANQEINSILILNSLGTLVKNFINTNHDKQVEINVKELTSGIYLIRVRLNNGTFNTKKIIIN